MERILKRAELKHMAKYLKQNVMSRKPQQPDELRYVPAPHALHMILAAVKRPSCTMCSSASAIF